ncbi:hypothetical protein L8S00_20805 [Vibrio splendidus]|uniref:hypothetical protein n=1 Tax=Vibrio splendidus TaxID=29497 RepID=UPI002468B135|nr:hypothetical protein [Vibrio splendidus]MDH5905828.1 hypothetical protein [Vibrio splendidus]
MTSQAIHNLEKLKLSAHLSLLGLLIAHKGVTKIFSYMFGFWLFLTYLGNATSDFAWSISSPEVYPVIFAILSFCAWLLCALCVYLATELIPNGNNWKGATNNYTNRDYIKLFFKAMKHNFLVVCNAIMRHFGIKPKEISPSSTNEAISENQIAQANDVSPLSPEPMSTESQEAQVINTASQGMTLGSIVIKGMIGIQIASWISVLLHNIYNSLTVKYNTLWLTDLLVGKKSVSQTMSDFGSEEFLSTAMLLFFVMLNYYIVQQAKMLLDGDEDCMNPHNMDLLSAFLRIFIMTAIHVALWHYMFTTTYAHLI